VIEEEPNEAVIEQEEEKPSTAAIEEEPNETERETKLRMTEAQESGVRPRKAEERPRMAAC
jgi:hypothetical protein